jgi:NTE family protein
MPELLSPSDEDPGKPEDGIALCLSGGGYRAMVFHLGSLIRLNEAGLIKKLSRISSVSGGSITAGALGFHWKHLGFDHNGRAANFDRVVSAVRKMASTSVDAGAIIGGILLPGTISDRVAAAYEEVLFEGATLADLPDDSAGEGPRFVINATNVQTGSLWRFSRPYMGDYQVGLVDQPDLRLATAVAASSAFPPVLSPLELTVNQSYDNVQGARLTSPEFRRSVYLSDGGVYDNLGLETAHKRYKTLLVSDGGQKIAPEPEPADDWARHSIRVLDIVDNQVRSLRKRHLIEAYEKSERTGCFWGIRTDFRDYKLDDDPLGCAARNPKPLAEIPTRLQKMSSGEQERLINWGYAICDAALRRHFGADLRQQFGVTIGRPAGFPYSQGY